MRTICLFALIFAAAFGTAAEERKFSTAVYILPMVSPSGAQAPDLFMGPGIQTLLEQMLSTDGELEETWAWWQYDSLFPKQEDLERYLKGDSQEPKGLGALAPRWVVRGSMDKGLRVAVSIEDRLTGKHAKREIRLDFPALIEFRRAFLALIDGAGVRIPPSRQLKMLWREDLTPRALALVGLGWTRYAYRAAEIPEFVEVLKLAPESYVATDGLAWTLYRKKEYAEAAKAFQAAFQLNPEGVDSIEGLVETAGRDNRLADAQKASAAYARVRGLAQDAPEAILMLGKAFQRNNHFENAESIFQSAIGNQPKGLPRQKVTAALAECYVSHAQAVSKTSFANAISLYQKALARLDELDDPRGKATILTGLAFSHLIANHHKEAIGWYQKALPILRELKDREGEQTTLERMGWSLHMVDDEQAAVRSYQQALSVARERKDRTAEVRLLNDVAFSFWAAGQSSDAIEWYQMALPIERELQDAASEATTLHRLGWVYERLDQYKEANTWFEKELAIRRELKDRSGEADSLAELGNFNYSHNHYDQAVGNYGQARAIYHELGKPEREARMLMLTADAYHQDHRSEKAVDFYQQALSLQRQAKDRTGEGVTLERLAFEYKTEKQGEQAIRAYQQGLEIRREQKDRAGEARALVSMADVYGDLAEWPKAVESYEQAAAIFRELKDKANESLALKSLSQAYGKLGQYAKGIEVREQSVTAQQEQIIIARDRVTTAASDFELVDHPNPAVLVLPFVAVKGLGDSDRWVGVTLQYLLENALMELPEFQTVFLTQNIRRGFHDVDQWNGFLRGEREAPSFAGFACVVNGRVERDADRYTVALAIEHDDGKVSHASVPVDFPNLRQIRSAFLEELRNAKCGAGELRPAALWPESLGVAAANALGRGRADNLAAIISGQPGHTESVDEAARLAPQSYLARLNSAHGYGVSGKEVESISLYEETAAMARSYQKPVGEIMIHANVCNAYNGLKQYDKAVASCENALALSQQAKNADVESFVLMGLANVYSAQGQNQKCQQVCERGLAIARQTRNPITLKLGLQLLAAMHYSLGQYEKAAAYYAQLVEVSRRQKDRSQEGSDLWSLGFSYAGLNQHARAIVSYREALAIIRETGARDDQMKLLYNLATSEEALGKHDTAIDEYNQDLKIAREMKDRVQERFALSGLGAAYAGGNQVEKSIGCYEQSLQISRELKDRSAEGNALESIGFDYATLQQFGKAFDYYERALAAAREVKNLVLEGSVLSRFGLLYTQVGQNQKALTYYEQALAADHEAKNRSAEARTMVALGGTYHMLGDLQKAQQNYLKAVGIAIELKDRAVEASVLVLLGRIYLQVGQWEGAIKHFEQAKLLLHEIHNLRQEATAQLNIGLANYSQKRYEEAAVSFELALSMARQLKLPGDEIDALTALMNTWKERGQPRLAIVVGKQAINLLQEARADLRTLDASMQQSFAKSNESTYRLLADLLAGQGRLAEAQQVLDLLKGEELSVFVARAKDVPTGQGQLTLTAQEADWEKRYREIADQLTSTGVRRGSLLAKPDRSAGEDNELAKLEADLEVGNRAFKAFLDSTEEAFRNAKGGGEEVVKVREAEGLMETLHDLGPGVVAVYTMVGEQGFRSILVTPDVQKGYFTAISAADLNKKILAFREVVRDPAKDPLPLAKELYNLLVKPMEKDLEGAQAQTIMWSLDGTLRYVPIAALHDGQRYLVERYRNVVFTPASQSRLKDAVSRKWRGLGLGVSQAHEGFHALPNVPTELHSIILEDAKATEGVVPGTVKLDGDFTKDVLRSELHKHYTMVHMASHFDFVPGTDKNSYLLLGDGGKLTLDEFRNMPQVLQGVELLTLSACDTAVGGEGADGKEVEGFAVLAQRQGAKAVIATLWEVADESTTLLMREFYRLRTAKGEMTKAEALRQAQVELLTGTLKGDDSGNRGTTPAHRESAYVKDPARPYSHPYFWAPFLLMGNWK